VKPWANRRAELCFRQLFPHHKNTCEHAALDILVDEVTTLRQQTRRLSEALADAKAGVVYAPQVDDRFTFGT
jgi:hypothetical protein